MIRVLIVDDQDIAREGLRALLEKERDFDVIGEATDGAEAVDRARTLRPDVVLMDVRTHRAPGLTAMRWIKHACPELTIIVVSMHEDVEYLLDAVMAGAVGYLLKDVSRTHLVDAIRTTVSGGSLVSPLLLRALLERLAKTNLIGLPEDTIRTKQESPLSCREREIVLLLGRGLSNKEIARDLSICESTVKTHLERVFAKLGVSDRTQAAIMAIRSDGLSKVEPK